MSDAAVPNISWQRRNVIERITEWWNRGDPRLCVVSGSFGTGKSHLMASLVDRDVKWWKWLAANGTAEETLVFGSLRADDRPRADATLRGWLDELRTQLEAELPELTSVVGVRETSDGSVRSEPGDPRVDDAVIADPLLTWDTFHSVVLREAARTRRVLLVIDGLDERDELMPPWIAARLPDLPDEIAVIASCSHDVDLGTSLVVDLDGAELDTERDLASYCLNRLDSLRSLDTNERRSLAASIANAAGGKFLYCHWVCNSILNGDVEDLREWKPPSGMAGVYDSYIHRLRERVEKLDVDWAHAGAVLGSVAVAHGDGISVDTLARVHGLPREEVESILDAAGQYLTATEPDDLTGLGGLSDSQLWRIGHFHFGAYLVDPDNPNRIVHVADAHRRLAEGLRQDPALFKDRYWVVNIVRHHRGAMESWTETALYTQVDPTTVIDVVTGWDWLEARIGHDRDVSGAISDLRYAVDVSSGTPQATAPGECGVTAGRLANVLQLAAGELGDLADAPIRLAQQLQHHSVRSGDRRGEKAARIRLEQLGSPHATLSWSTQHHHSSLLQVLPSEGILPSIAWSPAEGTTLLAVGGDDGIVRIWDTAIGKITRTLMGHRRSVVGISWSPDGGSIVSVGVDGTVQVAQTGARAAQRRLPVADGAVAVAWSPTGTRIATAHLDGTTHIWDVASDAADPPLVGHDGPVRSVAWERGGRRLVTAGDDGTVRIWDVESARADPPLGTHDSSVQAVGWAPGGTQIVSVDVDGAARIWDTEQTDQYGELAGPEFRPVDAAWSPDGRRLAITSREGVASIWDIDMQELHAALTGHVAGAAHFPAAWSADGDQLATTTVDGAIRIWDTAARTSGDDSPGHVSWVETAKWAPDGRRLVTIGPGGAAFIWDGRTGRPLSRLEDGFIQSPDAMSKTRTRSFRPVDRRSVAWSPTGRHLVTAGGAPRGPFSSLRIWTPKNGYGVAISKSGWSRWSSPRRIPSPRHKYLSAYVDVGGPGSVTLGGLRIGRARLRTLLDQTDPVTAVDWSPDGRFIVTGDERGMTRVWNATSGSGVASFTAGVGKMTSVAWSPDSSKLVVAGEDESAVMCDFGSRELEGDLEGHTRTVLAVAWSPDGERVATGSGDHTARIWESRDRNAHGPLLGHSDDVTSIAWSADAAYVVTGSLDRTVRVWDANTRRRLLTIGFIDAVHSIDLSDRHLAVGHGRDVSVLELHRLWRSDTVDDT